MRSAKLIILVLTIIFSASFANLNANPRCYIRQPNQLLKVVTAAGQIGFINKSGRLVIGFDRWPRNLAGIEEFHEGLAAISFYQTVDGPPNWTQSNQRKAGFINETGRLVIPAEFDAAGNFCGGLALVYKDKLPYYIDRTGKKVFDPKADCELQPEDYSRSPRALEMQVELCHKLRVEGLEQKYAKRSSEGQTEPFSEGLAAIVFGYGRDNARYGFVDTTGKLVIQPRFEPEFEHHGFVRNMTQFSEGLAKVKLNGRYGYINKKGELVIPAQFDSADDFSEGLAHVHSSEQAGYIDHRGRMVISLDENRSTGTVDRAGRFSEGLAAIRFRSGAYGYIDRTGRVVIPQRFEVAGEFIGGVAWIYLHQTRTDGNYESGYGYINRKGEYIWKPQLRPPPNEPRTKRQRVSTRSGRRRDQAIHVSERGCVRDWLSWPLED